MFLFKMFFHYFIVEIQERRPFILQDLKKKKVSLLVPALNFVLTHFFTFGQASYITLCYTTLIPINVSKTSLSSEIYQLQLIN